MISNAQDGYEGYVDGAIAGNSIGQRERWRSAYATADVGWIIAVAVTR